MVLAREVSPGALAAAVRAGELERVRPGAYRRPTTTTTAIGAAANSTTGRTAAVPTADSPKRATAGAARELALARIAAISRSLRTPFWFSHESAALIWGCPTWTPPAKTHIIQTMRPNLDSESLLARHLLPLDPSDRGEHRGVPVTSLNRTVVDCLCTLPPLDALVIADGALRFGADRDAIATRLGALGGRRGVVGARTVFEYADGRAESPWETYARYVLLRFGLPRPELQVPIHTRLGWFRADLGWREWKLMLEFDGFTKYSTLAGQDPARVVFAEKRRQEAIEEEGWTVLRATAPDFRRSNDLIQRLWRHIPPHLRPQLTPVRAFATLSDPPRPASSLISREFAVRDQRTHTGTANSPEAERGGGGGGGGD